MAPIGMYFLTIDTVFKGEFVELLFFFFPFVLHLRNRSIVRERGKRRERRNDLNNSQKLVPLSMPYINIFISFLPFIYYATAPSF